VIDACHRKVVRGEQSFFTALHSAVVLRHGVILPSEWSRLSIPCFSPDCFSPDDDQFLEA
jgi:hypothetical protein